MSLTATPNGLQPMAQRKVRGHRLQAEVCLLGSVVGFRSAGQQILPVRASTFTTVVAGLPSTSVVIFTENT